ncbi:MAG: metallophosphoesterase [Isosphaeraceae bacterium]
MNGCLAGGPDGWLLDPAGAAIHPSERVAVVADVHLGYEWAREAGGDCLPEHSLAETISKLEGVLRRAPVDLTRLVVAGDLVESPRPCVRTSRAVVDLSRWLGTRGVVLDALKGNHDPPGRGARTALEVAGWTIAHGDRPLNAPRTITGHLHPRLRISNVNAPCFVIGPTSILLPAFSPNAAGVNLKALNLIGRPDGHALRCVATADDLLLDLGPLPELLISLKR